VPTTVPHSHSTDVPHLSTLRSCSTISNIRPVSVGVHVQLRRTTDRACQPPTTPRKGGNNLGRIGSMFTSVAPPQRLRNFSQRSFASRSADPSPLVVAFGNRAPTPNFSVGNPLTLLTECGERVWRHLADASGSGSAKCQVAAPLADTPLLPPPLLAVETSSHAAPTHSLASYDAFGHSRLAQ
jgi:hypothetical protein